jgi:hypothetical protein
LHSALQRQHSLFLALTWHCATNELFALSPATFSDFDFL